MVKLITDEHDFVKVLDDEGNVLDELHMDSPELEELQYEIDHPDYWWKLEAEEAVREEVRAAHFAKLKAADAKPPLYPTNDFLVEDIMPTRELYLWAGASGAGKSTLLYDFINRWQREQPVWGKKTFWRPYVIISRDRSMRGICRTLRRLGLNPAVFNIDNSKGAKQTPLDELIKQLKAANPDTEVFFVEGIHIGVLEGNDYGNMSAYLQKLNDLCEQLGITIIGTTHASKTFATGNSSGRDGIIGSAVNAGMSESTFIQKVKNGKVHLTIHPRNASEMEFCYQWLDGKLIPSEPDKKEEKGKRKNDKAADRRQEFLSRYEEGQEFKKDEYIKATGVKSATAERDLRQAKKDNLIKEVDKGRYEKLPFSWTDSLSEEE